jgi:uncharacterized protein DUF6350
MTDLLSRPNSSPPPDQSAPGRDETTSRWRAKVPSTVFLGVVAASWTAVVGIAVVVAVAVAGWFAAGSGSFSDALRIGGLGWLVANGSGMHVGSTSIGLLPLGALLVVGAMLYRAGRWIGSRADPANWSELAQGALSLATAYAALVAAVATATRSDSAHVGLLRVVALTLALSLVTGGLGVLQGAERLSDFGALIPKEVRAAGTGGIAGALALVAASGAVFTVALARHFSTAVTLADGMHAGLVGGGIATLIGLALVPNAVLFAGAFLAGPGFAVGTGTVVAPGEVSTGPLPGFPLLAAVPRAAGSPWIEVALLLVPVLAGAGAGLLAVRRYPVPTVFSAAIRGSSAGLVAGAGFGVMTLVSAGSVGPGRMQHVGPGASVLLVYVLTCSIGGAVAAAANRWFWSTRVSDESVS